MADNGMFRSAFRGFNKQDVLNYIEESQMELVVRANEAERSRVQAEEAASLSSRRAIEAESKLQVLEKEIAPLHEQNEKLTALAKAYKRELMELREQVSQNEAKEESCAELADMNDRLCRLAEENALLKEQNARYLAVVGDMSSLIIEARVLSSSYFENAHQKSVECIARLDTFLDELKIQAENTRALADAQKKAGEDQIESLLEELQKRSEI